MFNALKYIKNLENVGFKREQAEAQVQLVLDSFEDSMATKADILEIRSDITKVRSEMAEMKFELSSEIVEIRSDLAILKSEVKAEISEFKTDIITKLGGLMVVCATIMTGVLGFLIKF